MYTNTDPLSPRLFHSWSPVVHSYIAARQSSFSAYIRAEIAQLDNPRSMQQDSQRGISLYTWKTCSHSHTLGLQFFCLARIEQKELIKG